MGELILLGICWDFGFGFGLMGRGLFLVGDFDGFDGGVGDGLEAFLGLNASTMSLKSKSESMSIVM